MWNDKDWKRRRIGEAGHAKSILYRLLDYVKGVVKNVINFII